jgi:hypothetical protein
VRDYCDYGNAVKKAVAFLMIWRAFRKRKETAIVNLCSAGRGRGERGETGTKRKLNEKPSQ